MNIVIQRDSLGPIAATGKLTIGELTVNTLEDEWAGNKPFKSCIPAGEYRLVPHQSDKYGRIWAMVNPDLDVYHQPADIPKEKLGKARFACLFVHSGNTDDDVEGCVCVGLTRGMAHNVKSNRPEPHVFQSREAVKKVVAALSWVEHKLTIKNP